MVGTGQGASGYLKAGLAQKQVSRQKLLQTPSMQVTMRVMAARISSLRKYAREIAEQNPLIDLTMPDLPQGTAGMITPQSNSFDIDHVVAPTDISLTQHVTSEINQMFNDADDRYVAMAMVAYLSPAGWLEADAEAALAARGIKKEHMMRVLKKLQDMTPAGLWARDLKECLALQCQDRGVWTEEMALVLDNLDEVLDGNLEQVTGLNDDTIRSVMVDIQRCNPKPGAVFTYDEGDIFTPDLIITQIDGALTVTVNQDGMPSLNVKATTPTDPPEDEAQKILIDAAQREVSGLRRALQNRAEMLLTAGQMLAQRQREFLLNGEGAITPFSMTELAAMMGCHKSTVSRLVADKLVQTPIGMMSMDQFFAAGLKQPDGRQIAGRAVAVMIKSMLAGSADDDKKWTDQAIVDYLKSRGITIARRTVNKYRH